MEISCPVKLEPKIENNEDLPKCNSNGKTTSNVAEEENQPSSSASVFASTTNSSMSQAVTLDLDSDESEGDIIDIMTPLPNDKILEVVAIDSDSLEEDEDNSVQICITPRKAGLRQLQKRRCFKTDSLSGKFEIRHDYQKYILTDAKHYSEKEIVLQHVKKEENSESDDSDGEVVPKKRRTFSDPDKVYNIMDEPCRLLKKLRKNKSEADVILEKYTRCAIDGGALSRRKLYDLEMAALREIFDEHGKIIERLSLNKFYWEETKVISDYAAFNLYILFTKLCKNLQVFKFSGPFASIKLMKSPKTMFLPNLREIYYTCGDMETAAGDNRDNVLHSIYSKLFKGATSLERLDYTFLHLNEAVQLLKALKDATEEIPLKCFKRLKLKSSSEDGVINEEQMLALSSVNVPNLEYLEIGNGFWEDVKAVTFEKMLSKFPKLQSLIFHGSRQGDPLSVKSDFCIRFPRMDKLTTLSIGAEYEFESIIQAASSNTIIINDTTVEFLKFQIRLPHLPNLKSIILGNLINIDSLTFKDLPNLKVFKVGGPWNQTCNFLGEQPHWKITDLQFPDALKDSSLSKRIPVMFPSLKKLWIFLPSVFCLRGFFEAMANARHVKIEELHLKTQFDFESTLESCLLGRSTASLRSKQDVKNLNLLQRYSHFEDYVKYYNIELPIVKDEEDEEISSPGIGVLKSLKVLQMEHIPRVLRIPIGKFHWLDHRCIFTNNFIGYRKYPLSQKCINELHIKNLHTFVWPNFEFYGSLRKFAQNGLEDFSSLTASYHDEFDGTFANTPSRRHKLRVTVQPSMLRTAEFKIKREAS